MKIAAYIIFGILTGVGLVVFWPFIIAIVYVLSAVVVAVLMAVGHLIFYIGVAALVLWLAHKLAKSVCRSID